METGTQKLSEGSFMSGTDAKQSFIKDTWGNVKTALIGCGAAIIFGLAVLLMSISSATGIGAQDTVPASPSATPVMVQEKVEYYLPYPGVLPDSPLYKVKMIRDSIRKYLTLNPLRRATLELLYADKRINAAQVLMEGGKTALAIETATKAEKYLEMSVNKSVELYEEGKDSKSLLLTQKTSVAKHLEILEAMASKTSSDDRKVLDSSLNATRMLAEKLSRIDFNK
jgi:hypothetical protein